jgi:ribosomal protein RSM22 (predicted rRNA methylase)
VDFGRLALDDAWLGLLGDVARAEGLDLPPRRLAAELRALSEAYNTGAFARARSRGALAARLAFSFPRDVPKTACAARELAWAGHLAVPEDRALRVLDVGAGLGASTWGLARLLASRGERGAIEATFVDDDPGALGVARAIASARRREGGVDVRVEVTSEAAGAADGRYDVVLVGQSLGEIDEDEAAEVAFLERLLEGALSDRGSLVVVEPALAQRTRRLHRVRDALAVRGHAPFAPCLHAAPCPMLADPNGWCHEDLPVDLPAPVAALARAAGLRWQGLTFSYLVLRKDGRTLRDALGERAPHALRVVSGPIVTKGKRELYLCGGGRLRKVARLDRDERTRPSAWPNASRGDVLELLPLPAPDRPRIAADVDVTLVDTS